MRLLVAVLVLSATVLGQTATHSAGWCNGGEAQVAVRDFVSRLQAAVAKNDRAVVADLVRYPVGMPRNKRHLLKSPRELLRHYDAIFTPEVKQALAAQDPSDLFCNYQGAMIRDGEIWVQANEKGQYQIIAFNPSIPKRPRN